LRYYFSISPTHTIIPKNMSKLLTFALFTLFLTGAVLIQQSYSKNQAPVLQAIAADKPCDKVHTTEGKGSVNLLALVMAPTLNTLRKSGQVTEKEEKSSTPGASLLAEWPGILKNACMKMMPI
jgi:hypothetical protein